MIHALAFGFYLVASIMNTYVDSWRTYVTNEWFLVIKLMWIGFYTVSQFILTVILKKLSE